MKNLVVSSTRTTAIGTFIPGVVYVLDESSKPHEDVINALVNGKSADGRKARAPAIGKLLSDSEAKAYREEQGRQAEAQVVGRGVDMPSGDDVVTTANLKGLTDRAVTAEAKVAELSDQLDASASALAAAQEELEVLKAAADAGNGGSK